MPIYKSPAKINLFLRVLGKRPDGFHELSTFMQTVDLCDTLNIHLAEGPDRLVCTDPTLPADDSNLVMKAVHLFRAKTGLQFNVEIHLNKQIPHQAGLGGGSSNAATTLWALNELLGMPASLPELLVWGGELGSDVSFFLSNGTAICTGRGEIIQLLEPLPQAEVWILKPTKGLSTPEVFRQLDLKQINPVNPQELLERFYQGQPAYQNDLEAPAFRAMPMLAEIKAQLQRQGYQSVTMTGSGSALFCFGGQRAPMITELHTYQAQFINRQSDAWY